MPQFQVPQFIETEAKIVGPLTLKQFLYIAAAGLLSFFLFFILKTFVWIIFTSLLVTLAAAFAFIKYNGRPLTIILISALDYLWKPKLYLWKRSEEAAKILQEPEPQVKETPVSRLRGIWLKLHTAPSAKPISKAPLLHTLSGEKEHASRAFELLKKAGEKKV